MVEMVEIYLEKVRDLLSDGPAGFIDGPSLEIRHRADESDNPVPGLTSVSLKVEVMGLLASNWLTNVTRYLMDMWWI